MSVIGVLADITDIKWLVRRVETASAETRSQDLQALRDFVERSLRQAVAERDRKPEA